MDTNFINNPTGRQFLERTMPELVRQLDKLNHNIEKLIAITDGFTLEPADEPYRSAKEINEEIKESMKNIVNIRKDFNNDN